MNRDESITYKCPPVEYVPIVTFQKVPAHLQGRYLEVTSLPLPDQRFYGEVREVFTREDEKCCTKI